MATGVFLHSFSLSVQERAHCCRVGFSVGMASADSPPKTRAFVVESDDKPSKSRIRLLIMGDPSFAGLASIIQKISHSSVRVTVHGPSDTLTLFFTALKDALGTCSISESTVMPPEHAGFVGHTIAPTPQDLAGGLGSSGSPSAAVAAGAGAGVDADATGSSESGSNALSSAGSSTSSVRNRAKAINDRVALSLQGPRRDTPSRAFTTASEPVFDGKRKVCLRLAL